MADPQCVAELLPGLELAVRQAARQELPPPADHFFADNFPEYKAAAQELRGNISRLLDQASQVLLLPKHRAAQAAAAASTAAARQDAADPATAVDDQFESAQQVLEDCLERLDTALDAAQQQLQEYKDEGIARPGVMTISGPLASWRLTGSGVKGAACVLDNAAAGRGRVGLPQAAAGAGSRPQDRFATPVDNSNAPWWPNFKHLAGRVTGPPAAGEAAAHPYREELQQLRYQGWQLEAGTPQPPPDLAASPVTWVDTPESLAAMVASLGGCREVALDLEHHSYHSFQGFTCLLQVSSRTQDWLVDVLALREEVGPALAPLLADPGVVKVLHGADHDVVWLQRDFGLYLVNMFDTGQAARVLGYPSASLAHLLSRHAGFTPDKRYQLADWRLRPLSAAMKDYARCDTHFLLFCYDVLRAELVAAGEAVPSTYVVPLPPSGPQGALGTVLERSRQLCAATYTKELLTPNTAPSTAARWQLVLAPRPMAVFSALFAWRDTTARRLDESTGYVLPKGQLMTLAKDMPATADKVLKALGRSAGAYVRQHAEEVAGVIAEALAAPLAPNLAVQDPAAAGAVLTGTSDPNPAAADGTGLQEPDAAAARQLVKPKVLGSLTGAKRPAPGGMFGAAGKKPARTAAGAPASSGHTTAAAGAGAAGAQAGKTEADQQQQQQAVQQEQQRRQQVAPKVKAGSSSMAAVFGKRHAPPSAAAAALFKPAGPPAAAAGPAGVAAQAAPSAFRLPFQLQPGLGASGAATATAGPSQGASAGAPQQQQRQQVDAKQQQGAGNDSSSSDDSDGDVQDGEMPLQQTTAADIRAVVAQLRAEAGDTPAAPPAAARAGPGAGSGGRKRRAADALDGDQQQQEGEGDEEQDEQQQEQGSEEGGGDEDPEAEQEEEEEGGGLAAGADYVSLAQAFGSKRRKQRGVRTAPTPTSAAAAAGGGDAGAPAAGKPSPKRPKPMFKRGRGGSSSDSEQDSGSEDLADLAQQHLDHQKAAGGGFDYAAAKAAALANAPQEAPSRGRGRRGGRGGRGRKGQTARGAAMAAAAASLAAVRQQAGRGAAANPYALPSENMIRGGKRSAVAPRSGNRSLSFK